MKKLLVFLLFLSCAVFTACNTQNDPILPNGGTNPPTQSGGENNEENNNGGGVWTPPAIMPND